MFLNSIRAAYNPDTSKKGPFNSIEWSFRLSYFLSLNYYSGAGQPHFFQSYARVWSIWEFPLKHVPACLPRPRPLFSHVSQKEPAEQCPVHQTTSYPDEYPG